MNLPTFYAEGIGNTFLIVINDNPLININSSFINKVINNNKNLDFDGVLVVLESKKYEFELQYFNNDGSFETLCINGCRCAAFIMNKFFSSPKKFKFLAGDGVHSIHILKNQLVKIKLTVPKYITDALSLFGFTGRHVNVGVNHFAILSQNISGDIVRNIGRKIRFHEYFEPKGTNVNFYKIINKNMIEVHTYEKGVEKYMPSCASGSIASCYDGFNKLLINSPVNIITPGGKLMLDFNDDWSNAWLTGSVKIISQIQ